MGVMSSCSLSQTRLSRSSLPGLDQATGRPLNGTRHRPRAHSHSHTPSLNVLSDWLSHRGAHTTACGPKCYSSRLAARTMITAAWPRGIALSFIGFFATDLVSRRFNTCRRRHRQLEQLSLRHRALGLAVRAMSHLFNPERLSRQLALPGRGERRLSRVPP